MKNSQTDKTEALRTYAGDDAVISSHELALKLKEGPQSLLNLKSGIPSLDHAVDGFRNGELNAISGPTKQGKTLLAQSFTVAFVDQQSFPLWFSYEVPARQFLSQFRELPLIYLPGKLKAHAMDWIEDRIEEAFLKYHSRVVFIDHLHYLIDMARLRNPSIEIGQVIRRLKTLAVDGGFCIFLLCHTVKGKSEADLSYESIRDSSFISQESDCVLMIKRTPEDGEGAARLRVEFHRRTGIMEKVVDLVKVSGLLRERAQAQGPGRREDAV